MRAPHFAHAPIASLDEGRYCVWLVEPNVVVSQMRAPSRLTRAMAALLPDVAWPALARRPAPPEGFTIVGDWSQMTGYESPARQLLTKFTLDHRKALGRLRILLAEDSAALVRMGVTAASAVLAAAGLRLEVSFEPFERTRRELQLPMR